MAAGGPGDEELMERRWVVAIVVAVALAGTGTAVLLLRGGKPAALEDVERAQRAGTEAQRETRRLTENLDRIASNLEAGADLSSQSAEIEDLTNAQGRSLEKLAALLRGQLRSLQKTVASLKGTKSSSAGVARLGERQTRIVAHAVAALRRLEDLAREAGATTARITRQTIYGARLAEDSQRAFSGP
jgi:hypothetical protein